MRISILARSLLLSVILVLGTWFTFVFVSLEKIPQCEATVVIEVLNGCGIEGAAEKAASWLTKRGFDVFFIGNADDYGYDFTIIVDRCEDQSKIDHLANAIGTDRIVRQVTSSAFVDATVIVGRDFKRWTVIGQSEL